MFLSHPSMLETRCAKAITYILIQFVTISKYVNLIKHGSALDNGLKEV